jgi:hypothetical protein
MKYPIIVIICNVDATAAVEGYGPGSIQAIRTEATRIDCARKERATLPIHTVCRRAAVRVMKHSIVVKITHIEAPAAIHENARRPGQTIGTDAAWIDSIRSK